MKRWLAVLVAMVLLLSISGAYAASSFDTDNEFSLRGYIHWGMTKEDFLKGLEAEPVRGGKFKMIYNGIVNQGIHCCHSFIPWFW